MWFRVWAHHGPGHQGHTEEFMWRDRRPSKDEREEMWNWMVHRNYMDSANGEVNLVRELPEKVRLEKIRDYKHDIEHAMKMLKILGVPMLEPFILG